LDFKDAGFFNDGAGCYRGFNVISKNGRRTRRASSAKARCFCSERHGHPENVHFDISCLPIRDEIGSVRGVFCIVNNTTAGVRFELALR